MRDSGGNGLTSFGAKALVLAIRYLCGWLLVSKRQFPLTVKMSSVHHKYFHLYEFVKCSHQIEPGTYADGKVDNMPP
jgi:hypothetical protein